MGDMDKELVGTTTNNEKVYHIFNGAGVAYTTIEDVEGFEMYSCEREKEKAMFKALNIKFKD